MLPTDLLVRIMLFSDEAKRAFSPSLEVLERYRRLVHRRHTNNVSEDDLREIVNTCQDIGSNKITEYVKKRSNKRLREKWKEMRYLLNHPGY